MDFQPECVARGFEFLEAPAYSPDGSLFFSDILVGCIYELRPDGQVLTRIRGRTRVGGMALHAEGGFVVSGGDVSHIIDSPTGTVLLPGDESAGRLVFSDLKADARGRVLVGAHASAFSTPPAERKAGALYLIDLDGSWRMVVPDIVGTNGMAFSPDGRLFYYIESGKRKIWVFDYDEQDGTLSGKREFASFDEYVPDGMAVAEDGTAWVAMTAGRYVGVHTPDGQLKTRIPLDVTRVMSVCFGGSDLKDFYAVSGHVTNEAGSGEVYRIRVDVPGVPVHQARARLG